MKKILSILITILMIMQMFTFTVSSEEAAMYARWTGKGPGEIEFTTMSGVQNYEIRLYKNERLIVETSHSVGGYDIDVVQRCFLDEITQNGTGTYRAEVLYPDGVYVSTDKYSYKRPSYTLEATDYLEFNREKDYIVWNAVEGACLYDLVFCFSIDGGHTFEPICSYILDAEEDGTFFDFWGNPYDEYQWIEECYQNVMFDNEVTAEEFIRAIQVVAYPAELNDANPSYSDYVTFDGMVIPGEGEVLPIYTVSFENVKTEYEYGEEFYIEVYRYNEYGEKMKVDDWWVEGYDPYRGGWQEATVYCENLVETYQVYVNENVDADRVAEVYWTGERPAEMYFTFVQDVMTYSIKVLKDDKEVYSITKDFKRYNRLEGDTFSLRNVILENGEGIYTVGVAPVFDGFMDMGKYTVSGKLIYRKPSDMLPAVSGVTYNIETNEIVWEPIEDAVEYDVVFCYSPDGGENFYQVEAYTTDSADGYFNFYGDAEYELEWLEEEYASYAEAEGISPEDMVRAIQVVAYPMNLNYAMPSYSEYVIIDSIEIPDEKDDIEICIENIQTNYAYGEEFYAEVWILEPNGEYYQVKDWWVEGFDPYMSGWQTVRICYGDYSEMYKVYVDEKGEDDNTGSVEYVYWSYDMPGEIHFKMLDGVDRYLVKLYRNENCIVTRTNSYGNGWWPEEGNISFIEELTKYGDGEYRVEVGPDDGSDMFTSSEIYSYRKPAYTLEKAQNIVYDPYKKSITWDEVPDAKYFYVYFGYLADGGATFVNLTSEQVYPEYEGCFVDMQYKAEFLKDEYNNIAANLGIAVEELTKAIQIVAYPSDLNYANISYSDYISFELTDMPEVEEPEPSYSVTFENVKTEYEYGEEFYIEAYQYTAEGEKFVVEGVEIYGFDSTVPGEQEVTVRYGEYEETFIVYVRETQEADWYYNEETRELVINFDGDMEKYDFDISSSYCSAPWYYLNTEVESIIISDRVTSISDGVFCNFSNLRNVTIGENVRRIGAYAFNRCTKLTQITVPDSVNYIGVSAFAASGLKTVELGKGLTQIASSAFSSCKFTEITLPDSLKLIGSNAFGNCRYLCEIYIPRSVTVMQNSAFKSCVALTDIYYEGTEEEWSYIERNDNDSHIAAAIIHFLGDEEQINSVIFDRVQTMYYEGEEFSAEVLVEWEDGRHEHVEDYTVEGYDAYFIGEQNITISFGGYSEDFTVIVKEKPIIDENVTHIRIKNLKAVYYIGEEFEAEVYAYTKDGNCYIVDEYLYYDFDSSMEDEQQVTVRYGDFRDGCTVYIYEEELTESLSGTCGNKLTWTLDTNGVLTISGTGEMTNYENTNGMPWHEHRGRIKEIIIEDGVTSIGKHAFAWCYGLNNVIIPDTVTNIADYAFYACTTLPHIRIPDGASIGSFAFASCERLENVDFGANVTIGEWAFSSCESLTNVTLHADTIIGECVFRYCDSLEYIHVDDSNPYYCSIDGNLFDKNKTTLIQYAIGKRDEFYEIPDGVTVIGEAAFDLCTNLTSITIPNSVGIVEEYAFRGCKNLADVYYKGTSSEFYAISVEGNNEPLYDASINYISTPEPSYSVTFENVKTEYEYGEDFYIEVYEYTAEGEKVAVEGWEVEGFDSTVAGQQRVTVKYGDYSETFVVYVNEVYEPSWWEYIPDTRELIIREEMGNYGFDLNAGYTEAPWAHLAQEVEIISIWDGVTSITSGVFINFTNLKEVNLGGTVNRIAPSAFDGCTALEHITIPDSVVNIGTRAFANCGLRTIDLGKGIRVIGPTAFQNCKFEIVYLPESLSAIRTGTFAGCRYLKEIHIPASVTKIESGAFNGCIALTDVYFGGTEEEWNNFEIANGSGPVLNVTMHYNNEEKPTEYVSFENVKTEYEYGEEFYAEVWVTDSEGNRWQTESFDIFGFDSFTTGWQSVTISYEGFAETFDVYVREKEIEEPYIVSVDFELLKDTYYLGEELIVRVYENMSDGTCNRVYDYEVVNFDSTKIGTQMVTVNYNGFGEQFVITVENRTPSGGGGGGSDGTGPVITVSEAKCRVGNTVEVTVSISENTGFANLGLEIKYDAPLNLVNVIENAAVDATFTSAQNYDIYPYNIGFDSISGSAYNGDLVTLVFEVPEDIQPGEYNVYVDYFKGRNGDYIDGESVNYDENENPLNLRYENGFVNVYDYIPGDINGDETVNNKDGTALLRYLAGWTLETIDMNALDVDGNGEVNNKDGTRLLRYLAGWDVEVY